MAGTDSKIDTCIEIITPENIAFAYRVAGPFRRLPAYLVDLGVRAALVLAALIVMGLVLGTVGAGGVAFGAWFIFWFIISWFYGGLFETYWNGQTPGKLLLRIRVLTTDGQPIGGWQAVLRNILRALDLMPPLFCGFFATMMNDRFQRLGDLACGTMVVAEDPVRRFGVVRVDDPDVVRLAAEVPAGFLVNASLARALSAYVLRRRSFTWGRRMEIARHVGEPLRCRLDFPPGTSHDLLLCAVYHRTFFADGTDN